jgi:hypothetical protein
VVLSDQIISSRVSVASIFTCSVRCGGTDAYPLLVRGNLMLPAVLLLCGSIGICFQRVNAAKSRFLLSLSQVPAQMPSPFWYSLIEINDTS